MSPGREMSISRVCPWIGKRAETASRGDLPGILRTRYSACPRAGSAPQTIARLGEMVGAPLVVQRFRPNLLVEAVDETPFPEDAWVGTVLRVGGLRLRVDKRDGRCAVITLDPATTERNPAILRAVAQERQGCRGVYGSTVEPGRVALNAPVLLESPD